MPHIPSPRPTLPGLATSVLAALLWLLPGAGLAFAVRDVPNPRQSYGGWVFDGAGILRQDTETNINGMINILQQHDGSEMVVVTVPDTSGSSSPKTFATELFNTLKIGKKGIDNGVLMLISKGDRRVEIETGYGIEERLPDSRAGAIISTAMLPRFKEGNFDGGTLAGVGDVIGLLSPEARKNLAVAGEEKQDSSKSLDQNGEGKQDSGESLDENKAWDLSDVFVLMGMVAFGVLAYRLGFFRDNGDGSSNKGSNSSSNKGSDRFGGGRSGGGGAGGSW